MKLLSSYQPTSIPTPPVTAGRTCSGAIQAPPEPPLTCSLSMATALSTSERQAKGSGQVATDDARPSQHQESKQGCSFHAPTATPLLPLPPGSNRETVYGRGEEVSPANPGTAGPASRQPHPGGSGARCSSHSRLLPKEPAPPTPSVTNPSRTSRASAPASRSDASPTPPPPGSSSTSRSPAGIT